MQEYEIETAVGDVNLKSLVVVPDGDGPFPAVLIFPQWSGRSPHEEDHARKLARQGYVAVATDLFGDKKRGASDEENQALITPLLNDRAMLRQRLLALVDAVGGQKEVDAGRLAACGYCFGGLCALDTARAGAAVRGVASFHGLFAAPEGLDTPQITASIAIYHGWDDPMAPPEHVVQLGKELSGRGADWYLTAYGDAVHAFTNKDADAKADGKAYDPKADQRSWRDFLGFLNELF
ncbi:dienelactone hydrolase family protein [Pacificimonas sp. ICDLI1SI03]